MLAPETRGMSQPFETMWMKAGDWLRGRKEKGAPLYYNQVNQWGSTLHVEQGKWKDGTNLPVANPLGENN